jgi:hypothetical protein
VNQSQIFGDDTSDSSNHEVSLQSDRCEKNHNRSQEQEKIWTASSSTSETTSRRATNLHHRLQIGGNYTRASIHPNGHTSFNGNLGGVQGIYEYRPMDYFYGAGRIAWKEGRTHNSVGKRSLDYIDVQERLGYTFGFDHDNVQLSLFSGAGYRHLGHKYDPDVGDTLKFFYNNIYVPVGFILDYAATNCFAIGLSGTWMAQVYPTVRIVPLDGARWITRRKFGNYFIELPLTFTLPSNKHWSMVINPSYERWQDGHTTAVNGLGVALAIPGNTYNFWGVDLNFGYSF